MFSTLCKCREINMYFKMNMIKKVLRNIIVTVGIIWTMMSLYHFECYAATSFKKTKVIGVMSTAVDGKIVLTWEKLNQADGYRVYEASSSESYRLISQTKKTKLVLKGRAKGEIYRYYVKAYKNKSNGKKTYSKHSKKVSVRIPEKGRSTIKDFLKSAIAPVGSVMYVWGGGWNEEDTAAGKEAKTTGLSKSWRSFSKTQKADYNYRNHRYQIHDGLDCSGYVGWCVYNVMNTQNNQSGYVMSASVQAKKFAGLGFGSYRPASKVKNYKAGDIMSSTCSCCGHVWIVIGQCRDGSVVLVHASPPGVQINGTTTPSGKKNSQAYRLAKKYMKKYYPAWYKKYPDVSRGPAYLSHYGQMRWKTTGEDVYLSDPDNYRKRSVENVLKDLFKTVR